ncbi:hypothetical protein EVAR_87257_1 [Eumeta japonica]|uniref:Uncharacterized protein n=1 Tax=Eumeta variegata TaxID=151549 RepID=A0A4C1YP27_EUMVA|nr:hypothetical protein EVAR_87257_1 [Eumeta japonica]
MHFALCKRNSIGRLRECNIPTVRVAPQSSFQISFGGGAPRMGAAARPQPPTCAAVHSPRNPRLTGGHYSRVPSRSSQIDVGSALRRLTNRCRYRGVEVRVLSIRRDASLPGHFSAAAAWAIWGHDYRVTTSIIVSRGTGGSRESAVTAAPALTK